MPRCRYEYFDVEIMGLHGIWFGRSGLPGVGRFESGERQMLREGWLKRQILRISPWQQGPPRDTGMYWIYAGTVRLVEIDNDPDFGHLMCHCIGLDRLFIRVSDIKAHIRIETPSEVPGEYLRDS